MTQLKYSVPSVGQKNTTAEPLVDTALAELKTVVNGELNSENLAAGGIEESKLSAALQTKLGSFVGLPLEAKKKAITTEETRESAVFGTMTTKDEVEVTVVENGIVNVGYMATWLESVSGAARAAIFIGANQLKIVSSASEAPAVQEAAHGGTSGTAQPLATTGAGLATLVNSTVTAYPGDVTTGQALGVGTEFGNAMCAIIGLPAGTYKISIRFKASSGKVTVKNRKLWCWVIG